MSISVLIIHDDAFLSSWSAAPLGPQSALSSGLMYMFQKRRCASKGRSRNPSLSSCLAEKKTGWATAEGRNGLGAMCHVSKGSERHLGKRWKMHENATQRPQSIKQKRTRALSDDPMYNWRIFEYRMIWFTLQILKLLIQQLAPSITQSHPVHRNIPGVPQSAIFSHQKLPLTQLGGIKRALINGTDRASATIISGTKPRHVVTRTAWWWNSGRSTWQWWRSSYFLWEETRKSHHNRWVWEMFISTLGSWKKKHVSMSIHKVTPLFVGAINVCPRHIIALETCQAAGMTHNHIRLKALHEVIDLIRRIDACRGRRPEIFLPMDQLGMDQMLLTAFDHL